MQFLAKTLVVIISGLAGTLAAQVTSQREAGEVFGAVQISFEADLNIIEEGARDEQERYNVKDVNTALARAKIGILASIPLGDVPLRSYAEQHLPGPVRNTAESVPKGEAEALFTMVRSLLASLTGLKTFQVDLTVNTRPQKALFELVPTIGAHISTRTNDQLTNVYRGEYEYKITKAGYKLVRGTINFIDRAGNTLDCELIPNSTPQPALPCQLR